MGEASVLGLTLVILVKDVILPMYRGNGKAGNGTVICPMKESITEIHTTSRLHEREIESLLDEFREAVNLLNKTVGTLNTQTALLERVVRGLECLR